MFETVAQMCDWKAQRRTAARSASRSPSARLARRRRGGNLARPGDRQIQVHKVWLAIDGGVIVQPDAAKANVESGIIYGLSNVLHERVTIKDGTVEQSNFHDYNVMRMSDLPEEMNVEFVDMRHAADRARRDRHSVHRRRIANAFYKLTGKRLCHMPFTPERVLETLKA